MHLGAREKKMRMDARSNGSRVPTNNMYCNIWLGGGGGEKITPPKFLEADWRKWLDVRERDIFKQRSSLDGHLGIWNLLDADLKFLDTDCHCAM